MLAARKLICSGIARVVFILTDGWAWPAQPGFPFNLNSAVDTLLKKEFDIHRAEKKRHPLMEAYEIEAVPYQHKQLNEWRDPFRGVRHHHKQANLIVSGGLDDVWVNRKEELIVVDYKATAKEGAVNIDAPWQVSYKRQL